MRTIRALPLRALPLCAALAALGAAPGHAQVSTPLDSTTLAAFRWRSIGPAIMAGRITDIEADPRNPKIFYVAAAAGGIWKTINAGTTFFPLFEKERVISMGDLAIAPSDPNILYAGTGEEDSRNSISPGGGVFKSTDAGRTWKLVGLQATQAIGRIVVHPTDPNTLYVAALGHTWDANPERGLYKSTDGGQTWQLSKFISAKAGFVDVAMDPSDPNTLYAAAWERSRGPYFLQSGGPGSGLWKTVDAGKTWTEIKGGGFPTTMKGRIGLSIAASNPKIIYAMIEADTAANPLKRGEMADTSKRAKTPSGLYRSADAGATWTLMNRNAGDARPFYYSQVRADPKNPDRVYWMSSVFHFSDDGGKTARTGALGVHTDWHAMWIDPTDPDHFIIGDDGGIAITWDKGGTFDFPNTFPIGQFYAVSFDMQKPYRVCGGLQDNGSWCGPSRTRGRQGATNADWFNVGGGDGFYTAQDPTDSNVIYSESQGGNISRLDVATGERVAIRSGGRGRARMFEDSMIVARGDTTKAETPDISRALQHVRDAAKLDSTTTIRFNWETPFFLSPHNSRTVYAAGSRVIKSSDRGDHFYPISPDLSTKDSLRINVSTKTTGGITQDATGAETHGTVSALAESPIRPGILYAGTDDGNVWVTRNDGGTWENLTSHIAGVPPKTWVSRVEPSHFDTATVYVTFDGHRDNNFKPYVFVSTDFGRTFASIVGNLPADGIDYVHVIREDPTNRNLLFVGTDLAAYMSMDRGKSWQRFMTGLPTVPVYDLKIHPREREMIAATHGRALWVVDIGPLEEMADSTLKRAAHVFAVKTAYQYTPVQVQMWNGNKLWQADNPPYGAEIVYRLAKGERHDSARVVITDIKGDTVRTMMAPASAGTHRITWDLRGLPRPLGPAGLRDSVLAARRQQVRADSIKADSIKAAGRDTTVKPGAAVRDSSHRAAGVNLRPAETPLGGGGGPGGGGGGFRGLRQGPNVEPGDYLVTIIVNGQTLRQTVHVERVGTVTATDNNDEGH